MIELEGIWKTYEVGGAPLHVLHDVSERIPSGDYVALMGPSGSGKSTLLNIIGCLDRVTRGTYRLEGRDVSELSEEELCEIRRHQIGFVFQSFHLVPRLTAKENVALPLVLAGVPRGERAERVSDALGTVGLGPRADHRPAELSGGECQRVAIARATVMRPRILLADEPTGNLDSRAGSQVVERLEELNRGGLTLIVVTHDPNVARRAQRVIRLHDGEIAARLSGRELGAELPVPLVARP